MKKIIISLILIMVVVSIPVLSETKTSTANVTITVHCSQAPLLYSLSNTPQIGPIQAGSQADENVILLFIYKGEGVFPHHVQIDYTDPWINPDGGHDESKPKAYLDGSWYSNKDGPYMNGNTQGPYNNEMGTQIPVTLSNGTVTPTCNDKGYVWLNITKVRVDPGFSQTTVVFKYTISIVD